MIFDRKRQSEPSARTRLARIAGPSGVRLLSDIFERSQLSNEGIDARKFRIDFADQRDEIRDLERRKLIDRSRDGDERYRLSLAALALVDSESARFLLDVVDRLLAYLNHQYKRQRDQRIPFTRICDDLQLAQESIATALRYLDDTPVIGTRASGDPGSDGWWLTPMESSLDYPDLDALLPQLAEWTERGDPLMRQSMSPLDIGDSQNSMVAPPTHYDRIVGKLKNNWILAWTLVAILALGVLLNLLDAIFGILARILSVFGPG